MQYLFNILKFWFLDKHTILIKTLNIKSKLKKKQGL